MDNSTLIFILFAGLIIIISLIWRFRIRKSKTDDSDFDRNDRAKRSPDLQRNNK